MISTPNPVVTTDNVDPAVTTFLINTDMVASYTKKIAFRHRTSGSNGLTNEKWYLQILSYNSNDDIIKIETEELESVPTEIPSILL